MARWKFILSQAVKGFGADRASSFAAAIAYYALLSVFPLAVFAVSLAGYFLRDASTQERVINSLMENLPLSGEGRQDLQTALQAVTSGRGGLGLLGLIGAAYSGSALFGALRTALNAVFNVDRQRPLVQGKLLDLGMVIGLGILLLLSLALTGVIAYAQKFATDVVGERLATEAQVLFSLAYFVIPAIVSLAVFTIVYRVVPHAALTWRNAFPGALVAALAFEALKIGFAFYVANFGNYDAVYGTLGFVIVFLLFAYWSAEIVLFGAEFTRAYVDVSSGAVPAFKPALPKRPMSLEQRALAMIKGLFVAPEPHHDERLPYAPAREGGPLTDRQAGQHR